MARILYTLAGCLLHITFIPAPATACTSTREWVRFTGRCRGLGFGENGPLLCGQRGIDPDITDCTASANLTTGALLSASVVYDATGAVLPECAKVFCENTAKCGGFLVKDGEVFLMAWNIGPPPQCGEGRKTTEATCSAPDCLWDGTACTPSSYVYPSGACPTCSCYIPVSDSSAGKCAEGTGTVLTGGHCMCREGFDCTASGSCAATTPGRAAEVLQQQRDATAQGTAAAEANTHPFTPIVLQPTHRAYHPVVLRREVRERVVPREVPSEGGRGDLLVLWCSADATCQAHGDRGAACDMPRSACICAAGSGPLCGTQNELPDPQKVTAMVRLAFSVPEAVCAVVLQVVSPLLQAAVQEVPSATLEGRLQPLCSRGAPHHTLAFRISPVAAGAEEGGGAEGLAALPDALQSVLEEYRARSPQGTDERLLHPASVRLTYFT